MKKKIFEKKSEFKCDRILNKENIGWFLIKKCNSLVFQKNFVNCHF